MKPALARSLAPSLAIVLALAGCTHAGEVPPVPGGAIGTLEIGDYICELGGDALGPAGNRVPAQDFSVINSSSYTADGVKGTYLLTGDNAVMTSGPRRGNRYRRLSKGFLRLVGADGKDGDLRCVVRRINNS